MEYLFLIPSLIFFSESIRWLLKKQDVLDSNKQDMKRISQEELKKLRIFFTQSLYSISSFLSSSLITLNCLVIINTCKQLSLRQRVAATSIVYFKRFYVSYVSSSQHTHHFSFSVVDHVTMLIL